MDVFSFKCLCRLVGTIPLWLSIVPKIIAKEIDEIIRALAFNKIIQRGLEDVKNKRTISNKDMEQKIAQW
jgi:hypothetical protein